MVKQRDVQALARPLKAIFPGFEIKGRMLFQAPIEHTLFALYFDHSGDPDAFYVEYFLLPLCAPKNSLHFSYGRRLQRSAGGDQWHADAPDVGEELALECERQAKPFLSGLSSARDVAERIRSIGRADLLATWEAIGCCLARAGDTDGALEALGTIKPTRYKADEEIVERAGSLMEMLSHDPDAAQRQLADWEEASIGVLGLQDFWAGRHA